MMSDGHSFLPSGYGPGHQAAGGITQRARVAPGDLTSARRRDVLAGTPRHACVPARTEPAG